MRRSNLLFDASRLTTIPFGNFLKDVEIPGLSLGTIDAALQARFFQKDPTTGQPKERWELKAVEVGCPPERIKEHLAACGFINETHPSVKEYTYAAWPGALVTRAAARLNDLHDAWEQGVRWKKLIVFGGKRPLQPDKESFEECCKPLCLSITEDKNHFEAAQRSWERINPQTELDMMRWVFENRGGHPLSNDLLQRDPEVIFVDAPMKPPAKPGGDPVRPNTEDTIVEWLKANPSPGSMLLSSGAPYGMAMDEAFWMLLEPYCFTVETFGHAAPDLPIESLMREVAGAVNRILRARKA